MDRIDNAASELREMEEMSFMASPVHSMHPLSKLFITLAFIITVISFNKYDLSGLVVMFFYPLIMFSLSGLSLKTCLFKMKFVLPFICLTGILNPFFDREVFLNMGPFSVTYGMISMATLFLKGILCVMASFILIASTSVDKLCSGLRKIHVPSLFVSLFRLCYRYITVMMDEVCVMTMAYKLRAPGQRGIKFTAWGSFLGQLLLRSMDRAEEIYSSMLLRGFNGEYGYSSAKDMTAKEVFLTILIILAFVLCRCVNISFLIGNLF